MRRARLDRYLSLVSFLGFSSDILAKPWQLQRQTSRNKDKRVRRIRELGEKPFVSLFPSHRNNRQTLLVDRELVGQANQRHKLVEDIDRPSGQCFLPENRAGYKPAKD